MNTPPEKFVIVEEDRLLNFAITCFEKVGLSNEHASVISRLLVNSDLRGVRSPVSYTHLTRRPLCRTNWEGCLPAQPAQSCAVKR